MKTDPSLLYQLLFDPTFSRNQQFSFFQDPEKKNLHTKALYLKKIRRQLEDTESEWWVQSTDSEKVIVTFLKENVRLSQTLFFSPEEWNLLNSPFWNSSE